MKGFFFYIDNNKEMFLEHKISILELFLKDHVTLKTGVMTSQNSAFPNTATDNI